MEVNNLSTADKILLKTNISTKNPVVRLIATIIMIAVILLYINAHMDGVISKKKIQEIEVKFETKDVYLMNAIARTCIEEGVNPIDSNEMMSCLNKHKDSAIKPQELKLMGSRFKRFFVFIFTVALLSIYFLVVRYKQRLIKAQESTND